MDSKDREAIEAVVKLADELDSCNQNAVTQAHDLGYSTKQAAPALTRLLAAHEAHEAERIRFIEERHIERETAKIELAAAVERADRAAYQVTLEIGRRVKVEEELAALRAKLAEAEKDGVRLDWLERVMPQVSCAFTMKGHPVVTMTSRHVGTRKYVEHDSFRAAIDAAIAAERGE